MMPSSKCCSAAVLGNFIIFSLILDVWAAVIPNSTTAAASSSSQPATITSSPSSSSGGGGVPDPQGSCTQYNGLGAIVGCDASNYLAATFGNQLTEVTTRPCWPEYGNPYSDLTLRDCDRTEMPFYYFKTGYQNVYTQYDKINANQPQSLSSLCAAISSSAWEDWKATAPIEPGTVEPMTTVTATFGSYVDEGQHYQETTAIGTWAPYTEYDYVSAFNYTATSPCCMSCTLSGGNVQVMYWPTPAPSPPVSTLVNAEGYTLYVF